MMASIGIKKILQGLKLEDRDVGMLSKNEGRKGINMNINDFTIPGGVKTEDVLEAAERLIKYFTDQVESAKMDAHPTYNDPTPVTLHLTEDQAQTLRDLLAFTYTETRPGRSRWDHLYVIMEELDELGIEYDEYQDDIVGEVQFL